jgi:hypothetical protein
MLLAIGLAALWGSAAVRPGSIQPGDITTISCVGSCLLAESNESRSSDRHWRPQHHTIAAITESAWKSAPLHAALAAARSSAPFNSVGVASSPDPPVRSAPPYLRHTPLLI